MITFIPPQSDFVMTEWFFSSEEQWFLPLDEAIASRVVIVQVGLVTCGQSDHCGTRQIYFGSSEITHKPNKPYVSMWIL